MSKRVDPVDRVVAFFESAPVETAVVVLAIVKGIVARRAPKTKAAVKPPKATAKAAPQPNGVDAADAATGPRP